MVAMPPGAGVTGFSVMGASVGGTGVLGVLPPPETSTRSRLSLNMSVML